MPIERARFSMFSLAITQTTFTLKLAGMDTVLKNVLYITIGTRVPRVIAKIAI